MNEFECLVVEAEPVTLPLASDSIGEACIKVSVRNTGEQVAVVIRATIRICMSVRIAGRRLRWCIPFNTQMSLEIEGKPCEQLEIPSGETVVFSVCTNIGGGAREKIQDFESPQIELELNELHDGVEFTRTLALSADTEDCN